MWCNLSALHLALDMRKFNDHKCCYKYDIEMSRLLVYTYALIWFLWDVMGYTTCVDSLKGQNLTLKRNICYQPNVMDYFSKKSLKFMKE